MGLFGKKKNSYEEASKNLTEEVSAADRLIMEQVLDDDNRASELVDELKKGNPLILNFAELEPIASNKLLAFFAGASYALEGRSVRINEKTYLFARKVDFFDGTLQAFIDNLPKN